MPDIRKQIAGIVKNNEVFGNSVCAYYYPDIPNKVKINATKNVNSNIDSFAAAGDFSVFNNFSRGMIFSNTGIYQKDVLESSKYINYLDIDRIQWQTKPDYIHVISANGIDMCVGGTYIDLFALEKTLKQIIKLAKTAGVISSMDSGKGKIDHSSYNSAMIMLTANPLNPLNPFIAPILFSQQQKSEEEKIKIKAQLQESNMDAATKQEVITKLNAEVVRLQIELRQEEQKSVQNSNRINELSQKIDELLDYITTLQQSAD